MTSEFAEISQLDAGATDYRDTNTGNNNHYYRVIYDFSNKPDMYSNPVKVFIP
jgi:hypothetical protein